MSSPADVDTAVSNPTFFQNHAQFWEMLCYLFTKHGQEEVWKLVQVDTLRTIVEQLQVVMETTNDYSVIQSNKDLLYHVYIVSLQRIKGGRTVAEMMAYERHSVLYGFHYLYKQLFQLKINLPLFGHVPTEN